MAKLLMSKDNPKGWKLEDLLTTLLEDLLTTLQDEVVDRMARIRGDTRPEARRVLRNSAEIISMLGECSLKAQDSAKILDSLGSKRGATGSPRIGPETE